MAGDFVNDNTLTVYIKRLRDKLEDDPQDPALIARCAASDTGWRAERCCGTRNCDVRCSWAAF